MKYLIGIGILAALSAGIVHAQDGDRAKRLAEIKQLEARAEKLLDAGRRAEAFDALARAAVLRDNLKKPGKKSGKAERKPKQTDKKKTSKGKRRASDFQKARDALGKAIKSGDMQALRIAAMRFHAVTGNVEKQLVAERAKRARLAKRLDELEAQLDALKKLMQR